MHLKNSVDKLNLRNIHVACNSYLLISGPCLLPAEHQVLCGGTLDGCSCTCSLYKCTLNRPDNSQTTLAPSYTDTCHCIGAQFPHQQAGKRRLASLPKPKKQKCRETISGTVPSFFHANHLVCTLQGSMKLLDTSPQVCCHSAGIRVAG